MKKFAFIFLFLYSCQPIEIEKKIVFDNNVLPEISVLAQKIEINQIYESLFNDPFIDHSLAHPPLERLQNWLESNFLNIGDQNYFKINIIDASLKKFEEENIDAKKFEAKIIYKYELYYLIEYNLFDNNDYLISSINVESFRTTTSGKFISISERDKIIDELILDSLIDVTNESEILLKKYMNKYIL